jgi:putative tryptophan/tyrosine transport system substrate-binding protein
MLGWGSLPLGESVRRREFMTLFGGAAAAAWPLGARGREPALPVVGYMSSRTSVEASYLVDAFEKGLREGGFVVGQNVAIESRWADNQYDRLPSHAADLVSHQVALIFASGAVQTIRAAAAATSTIPIVFVTGEDPVRFGLVASLNRPGGNLTGVSALTQSLGAKRLDILHQLLPKTARIAVLVNGNNASAPLQLKEAADAARALDRRLDVLNVANEADIDSAFATLAQHGDGAVTLTSDPFMNSHRDQIVALAARYKLPALFYAREYVKAGGLMSYGASFTEAFSQAGGYAARILRGEKPADLPVLQAAKFEFIINLKTARALGLDIPPTLLALADDVIE